MEETSPVSFPPVMSSCLLRVARVLSQLSVLHLGVWCIAGPRAASLPCFKLEWGVLLLARMEWQGLVYSPLPQLKHGANCIQTVVGWRCRTVVPEVGKQMQGRLWIVSAHCLEFPDLSVGRRSPGRASRSPPCAWAGTQGGRSPRGRTRVSTEGTSGSSAGRRQSVSPGVEG